MAGWTVVGTTDHHRPCDEIESLHSVTTQQAGPSQARLPVTGTTAHHRLRNPKLGRISVKCFKGHFGLFLP